MSRRIKLKAWPDPKQPNLWEQQEIPRNNPPLEQRVATFPSIEVQEDYGLTYDKLQVFLQGPEQKRRVNYKAAKYLFYGVNGTERFVGGARQGMPHELYSVMTTAERAAFFVGDGRLKYSGLLQGQRNALEQLSQYSAEQIVSFLVGTGWNYQAVRALQTDEEKQTFKKGSLIERVGALPQNVKQDVVQKFLRQKAVSSTMNSGNYDFTDMNAESLTNWTSANNYIRYSASHIKQVYRTRLHQI